MEGKKITKGFVAFSNDSVLGLKKSSKFTEVSFNEIGLIKTKRSAGNNILTEALVVGIPAILLGVSDSSGSLFSGAEAALIFGAIGLIEGAIFGVISILLKNSQTFIINGDHDNWIRFKEALDEDLK